MRAACKSRAAAHQLHHLSKQTPAPSPPCTRTAPLFAGATQLVAETCLLVLSDNLWLLQCADTAFAALCRDGAVWAWGPPATGGDLGGAQPELHDIVAIQAKSGAFAALRMAPLFAGAVLPAALDSCTARPARPVPLRQSRPLARPLLLFSATAASPPDRVQEDKAWTQNPATEPRHSPATELTEFRGRGQEDKAWTQSLVTEPSHRVDRVQEDRPGHRAQPHSPATELTGAQPAQGLDTVRLGRARHWRGIGRCTARATRHRRYPSKLRRLRRLAQGRRRCLLGRRSLRRRPASWCCPTTTCVCAPVRRHGLRGTLSRRRCLRLGPRPPLAATWAVHSQSYTTSPLSKPTPAPSPPCAWRRYLLGRFCLRRSIPALPGPPGLCRCGNPGRSQGLCYCFSNGRVAAGQSSEPNHRAQPHSPATELTEFRGRSQEEKDKRRTRPGHRAYSHTPATELTEFRRTPDTEPSHRAQPLDRGAARARPGHRARRVDTELTEFRGVAKRDNRRARPAHRARRGGQEDKAWTQSPTTELTEFRGAAKRRTRGGQDQDTEPSHRAQPQS